MLNLPFWRSLKGVDSYISKILHGLSESSGDSPENTSDCCKRTLTAEAKDL